MEDKLLYTNYDKETGISTVTLRTKWGTFTHSVKVHPDDEEIANKWDGCRFATYLCYVDKYKNKSKAYYQRYVGLKTAKDVLESVRKEKIGYNNFYIKKAIAYIDRQAKIYLKESVNLSIEAKKRKQNYREFVEDTLAKRRKIREYKEIFCE